MIDHLLHHHVQGMGLGEGVEVGVLDTVPDAEAIVINKIAVASALRHLTI